MVDETYTLRLYYIHCKYVLILRHSSSFDENMNCSCLTFVLSLPYLALLYLEVLQDGMTEGPLFCSREQGLKIHESNMARRSSTESGSYIHACSVKGLR